MNQGGSNGTTLSTSWDDKVVAAACGLDAATIAMRRRWYGALSAGHAAGAHLCSPPLNCPLCHAQIRIIGLADKASVMRKDLGHLGHVRMFYDGFSYETDHCRREFFHT